MKPVIGITCDFDPNATWTGLHHPQPSFWLAKASLQMVERVGGIPLLLASRSSHRESSRIFPLVQGLIFSGGDDLDPLCYGEEPHPKLGFTNPERYRDEFSFAEQAVKQGIPILGICAGFQMLNVVLGGTLYQDIAAQLSHALQHAQKSSPTHCSHTVILEKSSKLARLVGRTRFRVNSFHHQAIKKVGKGLRVVAKAPDGVIEAFEAAGSSFLLGVGWHPEYIFERPEQKKLLQGFIQAAKR